MDEVSAATKNIGVDLRKAIDFGPMIEKQGFVNCQLIQKRWPIGEWPTEEKEKQLGAWYDTLNVSPHLDSSII
jgi:hypothetical protein